MRQLADPSDERLRRGRIDPINKHLASKLIWLAQWKQVSDPGTEDISTKGSERACPTIVERLCL